MLFFSCSRWHVWLVCPHGSQDAFKIPCKDLLKVFEGLSEDLQRPSTWGREREREREIKRSREKERERERERDQE